MSDYFHQLPEKFTQRRDLSPTHKLAFAWVLTQRRKGVARFPTADELGPAIGVSRATAYRAIKDLEAHQLVRRAGDSFEVLAEDEWPTEDGERRTKVRRFEPGSSQNETQVETAISSQNETNQSQVETGQSQNETNQSQVETRTSLIERSRERERSRDARAPARAEESESMVWTSYVLRRLLMEAVERVIGSQPEIEGAQKTRLERYSVKATREVALADLDAFEEWLRVLPDSKARALKYGFEFAERAPGTWRDVLAEEQRRSRRPRSSEATLGPPSDPAIDAMGPASIAPGLRRRPIPRQEPPSDAVFAKLAAETPSIEEQLAAAKRAAGGRR